MKMEENNTEVMGINFKPKEITSNSNTITPKTTIKFLGFHFSRNLDVGTLVEKIIGKLQVATPKIWKNHLLPLKCKTAMYYALIQTHILCNWSNYLPFSTKKQMQQLQKACNNAIRAIFCVKNQPSTEKPKSVTKLRESINIPTVETLKRRVIAVESWKNREGLEEIQDKKKQLAIRRYFRI